MEATPQESRTRTLGIACTPAEEDAVKLYVRVHGPEGGISGLLRRRALEDVLVEAYRILDRLKEEQRAATPAGKVA